VTPTDRVWRTETYLAPRAGGVLGTWNKGLPWKKGVALGKIDRGLVRLRRTINQREREGGQSLPQKGVDRPDGYNWTILRSNWTQTNQGETGLKEI